MEQQQLEIAIAELASRDNHICEALDLVGMPGSRIREPGLQTLVSIIVSQQISTEAGDHGQIAKPVTRNDGHFLIEL